MATCAFVSCWTSTCQTCLIAKNTTYGLWLKCSSFLTFAFICCWIHNKSWFTCETSWALHTRNTTESAIMTSLIWL